MVRPNAGGLSDAGGSHRRPAYTEAADSWVIMARCDANGASSALTPQLQGSEVVKFDEQVWSVSDERRQQPLDGITAAIDGETIQVDPGEISHDIGDIEGDLNSAR
jgi:hypothetical protein